MRKLTTIICLAVAVLLGSAGESFILAEPSCARIQNTIKQNPKEAEQILRESGQPKYCAYYLALEYEKLGKVQKAKIR